jgi:histidyl-tRNA synthetase
LEALGIQDFLVKVNHRVVLEIMIKEAGCHSDMFKTICSSIDKLDKQPWAEVEVELKAKGVNEEQCRIIEKLTAFKGEPLKLLAELTSKNIFEKEGEKLKETFG